MIVSKDNAYVCVFLLWFLVYGKILGLCVFQKDQAFAKHCAVVAGITVAVNMAGDGVLQGVLSKDSPLCVLGGVEFLRKSFKLGKLCSFFSTHRRWRCQPFRKVKQTRRGFHYSLFFLYVFFCFILSYSKKYTSHTRSFCVCMCVCVCVWHSLVLSFVLSLALALSRPFVLLFFFDFVFYCFTYSLLKR